MAEPAVGPAYTMRSKDPDVRGSAADEPGPGEYSSSLRPAGPAYSMSQRLGRTTPVEETPAPGEYGAPGTG